MNCGDDSKASKAPASASTHDSMSSNKARKNKKRKQHKDKRDFRKCRNSTTPATKVNKEEVGSKKIKDVSEIIRYNCNKKRYYATKCQESQKSKNKY